MKAKIKFVQFLKKARQASGVSQLEVAEKLGYRSSQFVSNWERGRGMPPVQVLQTLAALYGVPEDKMFKAYLEFKTAEIRDEFFLEKRKSGRKTD